MHASGDANPVVVTNIGGTNATALITGGRYGVATLENATVTNTDGTITGGTEGVFLGSGYGTLVNMGDANRAALITGGAVGVFAEPGIGSIANIGGTIIGTSEYGVELFSSGRTLTNTGGTNAGALIQGGKSGVYLGGPAGNVLINTNATIIGISRYGVDADQGGSVTNAGTGALISGAVAGVHMGQETGESVANYGTITGAIGIEGFGGVTVTDAGTIIGTGGIAVTFNGSASALKFVPGNAFIQGQVIGYASASTLEFASGATTGTLTGVGADFQDSPQERSMPVRTGCWRAASRSPPASRWPIPVR